MNQDDIINKIKAIMRLARRAGSEGEKVAAESAAKRLANKAGIALENIEVTETEIRTGFEDDPTLFDRNVMEIGYITSVLRRHFGVIPVQHRDQNHSRKVYYTWIGTKINIEIAKHIYIILMRECRKSWREVRIARNDAKHLHYANPENERRLVALRKLSQRSFYDGWFSSIHRKLEEHPLRNDIEQFEAERRSAEEALQRMKEQSNIKDKEMLTSAKDKTSALLGYRAAETINLSRPCENGPWSKPQELTHK